MDDIARELGISKKTLYVHTKDKNDLVEMIITYEAELKDAALQKNLKKPGNAVEQLNRIMQLANRYLADYSAVYHYDLKKYYPGLHELMLQYSRKSMHKAIMANLTKGQKEDLYRKDIHKELVAKLHLSRLEKLPEEGLLSIDEYISEKNFSEIFEYHIRGIANEKGLKILNEIINNQKKESVKY